MKEKYFIYLMDDEAILYDQSLKKRASFAVSFEKAKDSLEKYIKPKTSVHLLIDQNSQDIHEEKLPPLLPWDIFLLFYHKKASCAALGGYGGFQFFRQNKETYFRWIHISASDARLSWISWTINHFGQVFFASLEGRRFLNYYLPSSKKYHLLQYSLPSQKTRHVVFKGKSLLLSRLSQENEDDKSCLHFLSRTYQDIYDNLDSINLNENRTNLRPNSFLRFITSQNKPSLRLRPVAFSKDIWIRRGFAIVLSLSVLWMGIETYRSYDFKRKKHSLCSEYETLKRITEGPLPTFSEKNMATLQKALDQFSSLKPYFHDPLKDFEKLSHIMRTHPISLESLKWSFNDHLEMTLSFLMREEIKGVLPTQFEALLSAFQTLFQGSQIQVLEAPYHSSPHETFVRSTEEALPLVTIRIKPR
jgi:hypothetical protein